MPVNTGIDFVVKAFHAGNAAKRGRYNTDGVTLTVHDAVVARRANGQMYICDAHFKTQTTARVLKSLGFAVNLRKDKWIRPDGSVWDGNWTIFRE